MSEFPNIAFVPNDKSPVLVDAYIRDMIHQPLSQYALNVAYNHIVYRLKSAGFYEGYDMKLISRYSFNFPIPDIEYHIDEFCPDRTVYLLTFSANGMHFITPPYAEDATSPMSWNEYIFRVFNGEKLPLLIRAPWAQAKFINVGGVG